MKVIMFDVGGVLVKFDEDISIRLLGEHGIPPKRARLMFHSDEDTEFSKGLLTGKQFHKILTQKYFGKEIPYAVLKDIHNQHIYGVIEETISLLKQLAKRKRVAILTDINEWNSERVKAMVDPWQYTDEVFQSHVIHGIKREKGTFEKVIGLLDVAPQEIIFIDDTPEKIERAKENGIHTILFRSSSQLMEQLANRGILKPY